MISQSGFSKIDVPIPVLTVADVDAVLGCAGRADPFERGDLSWTAEPVSAPLPSAVIRQLSFE